MELPGKDVYGVGLDFTVRKILLDFQQYVSKVKGGLSVENLRSIFKQFDVNNNGRLEPEEFEKCLNKFGVFLKRYEYQLIFKAFDKDGDGTIDFNEFANKILVQLNQRRRKIVEKAFESLDEKKSGSVTLESILPRANFAQHTDFRAGRKLEDQLRQELLKGLEYGAENGQISSDTFLYYYTDLGTSIANDDYFVKLVENTWNISESDESKQTAQIVQDTLSRLRERLLVLTAGSTDTTTIQKLFRQYDISRDNQLDRDEFEKMLKKLSFEYDQEYLSLVFKNINTSKSGSIVFQEFYNFLFNVGGAQK